MAGDRLGAIVRRAASAVSAMGTQDCTQMGEGCNGDQLPATAWRIAVPQSLKWGSGTSRLWCGSVRRFRLSKPLKIEFRHNPIAAAGNSQDAVSKILIDGQMDVDF